MPRITVLYFAQLRDRRGRDREAHEVPEGTTAGALYASLFPGDPATRVTVAYARNAVSVPADTVLVDGDEVAFLPPLGGG